MTKIKTATVALGAAVAAGALAYGVPVIASAASATPTPPATTSGPAAATPEQRAAHATAEAEVTGADADTIKAAVLAKLGTGRSVDRISKEDAAESTGAAYEVHARKADGGHVEVLLDKAFAVTAVKDRPAPGMRGRGGPHGNEKEVTGADADKVKAAVVAKLPGATVEHVSTEDAAEGTGAAFEAHVTKADGTHARVLLSATFVVTAVDAAPAGGRGGPGGHGGPGGRHGGPPPATTGGTAPSTAGSSYSGTA
ncbi:MAG: hypothetical protein NVSMB13_04350 [Mycobacteriales bacterium]